MVFSRRSGNILYKAIAQGADLSMHFTTRDGDLLWEVNGLSPVLTEEQLEETGEAVCEAIRAIAKVTLITKLEGAL